MKEHLAADPLTAVPATIVAPKAPVIVTPCMLKLAPSMTGLSTLSKASNDSYDFRSEEDDQTVSKFKVDYDKIVNGQIGSDSIASQQQYCKNIRSNSGLRFIDRQISTVYTPTMGLSLSRMNNAASSLPSTNSTQTIGISEDEQDANTVNLRGFFNNASLTAPTTNKPISAAFTTRKW